MAKFSWKINRASIMFVFLLAFLVSSSTLEVALVHAASYDNLGSVTFTYTKGSHSSYYLTAYLLEASDKNGNGADKVGTVEIYDDGAYIYLRATSWSKPYLAYGELDKDGDHLVDSGAHDKNGDGVFDRYDLGSDGIIITGLGNCPDPYGPGTEAGYNWKVDTSKFGAPTDRRDPEITVQSWDNNLGPNKPNILWGPIVYLAKIQMPSGTSFTIGVNLHASPSADSLTYPTTTTTSLYKSTIHVGESVTDTATVTSAGQPQVIYVAAGAGVGGTGADIKPSYPTGLVANDLILLQITVRDTTNTPTTPSGFTLLYGPDSTGTGRQWIYYKISGGTESGSVTVSIGGSQCKIARMYVFRNVATSNFAESASFGSGSVDTISARSVTTTVSNSLAVSFIFVNKDNDVNSFTGESGGDWTDAIDQYKSTADSKGSIGLQTAAIASAGTISGGSFKMSSAAAWGVRAFALRPLSPTGTVTFYYQKSGDSSWTQLGSAKTLPGSSPDTVTSDGFTPSSAGTWYFKAVYSGDGGYTGSESGATEELLTVGTESSTTTTSLSKSTITLGESVTDTATVSPSDATGAVTFYYMKSGDSWAQLGTVKTLPSSSPNEATSDSFIPSSAGTWYLKAVYSGDSKYAGSESGATEEVLIVKTPTTATTSLSKSQIILGESVTDTVMVSPNTATGTVAFYYMKSGDLSWTQLGTVQTLSGGSATSDSFTPTSAAIWYFKAVYSGDGDYSDSESGATDEPLLVMPKPPVVVSELPFGAILALTAMFLAVTIRKYRV